MVKINDTTAFPNTTPADDDHVIGTDISNTTNSADGETVTFTIGSISGSMKLIASADASNSSSLDFTGFDSGLYDNYMFLMANLIPQSDSFQSCRLKTSTNGGSSWDGSSAYWDGGWVSDFGSAPSASGSTSDASSIALASVTNVGSATGEYGVSGVVYVYGPHLSAYTYISVQSFVMDDSGTPRLYLGGGVRRTTTAVNAVQFYYGSGIESGTVTMYGLKNA